MSTLVSQSSVEIDGQPMNFTPTPGRFACFFARPNERTYLVGQGQSGAWSHGVEVLPEGSDRHPTTSSTSGYGPLEEMLHRLAEGGFVVDHRKVSHDDLVKFVIGGPMEKATLPPGTMDTWAREVVPFDPAKVTSMTFIATDVYLDLAEKVPGTRVGQRIGDQIVWRDGSTTPIEACSCWKSACLGCSKLRYYVDRDRSSSYEVKVRKPADPHDHCRECRTQE